MDPIIRGADVSGQPRQLGRAPGPAAPPAVSPPVPARAAPVPPAGASYGATAKPAPQATPPTNGPAKAEPSVEDALAAQAQRFDAERRQERAKTEQDIAKALADAERRGYAAGVDKGEAAALDAVHAQVRRLAGVATQLVQAKASLQDEAEDGIVEAIHGAVLRIVGEHAAKRDTIVAIVRNTLAMSRERDQLVVRLHPHDLALVEAGPRSDADGLDAQVKFSADPAIALGGCIVDSAVGGLDARLDTQLLRLRETLMEVRATRRRAEETL